MKKRDKVLWMGLVLLLVALDQLTKCWSLAVLRTQDPQPELLGLLRFTYAENRGAAFSFLQEADARWFFVGMTIVVVAIILWFIYTERIRHPLAVWTLAVITGGAFGNFIDRLFRGYVVDFIQTLFIRFPVFNLADSFLVCGAIGLIIYILFFYSKEETYK